MTLIELVMTMLIIAILAGVGAWLMFYTIKNAVYIPNQLNMDKLAADALDIMIEGDSQAKGLRTSRALTTAQANQVNFVNQDNWAIYYRLDTGTSKLYRSISSGPESPIPAYSNVSGITLSGQSGTLFTYYDANEAVTSIAANVRRINMTLIAQTGTGSYANWQGKSQQSSSIATKRLQ